jgi:hypothetical protein
MPRRSLLAVAIVFATTASACAPDDAAPPRIGLVRSSIVDGRVSSGEESVVAIALRGEGGASLDCSGTLVAPDLVLTARSCVATVGADGTVRDEAPTEFAIYAGADANARIEGSGPESASVRRLFVPSTGAMQADIALLQLDRAIAGPIATLRLSRAPKLSENLSVAGYGLNERNELPPRTERTGLAVTAVGPSAGLSAGQFATTETLCAGDFGTAAFASASGAVVGVATQTASGSTASARCLGGGPQAVFTDLVSAKDTIERAFRAVGSSPKLEAGADAESTTDSEDRTSAKKSKSDGADGEEQVSEDAPAPQVAIASSGCSSAPRRTAGHDAALVLLVAALVRALRGEGVARRARSGRAVTRKQHQPDGRAQTSRP